MLVGNPSPPTCNYSCRFHGYQRHASVNTTYLHHLVDHDNVVFCRHVVASTPHNEKQQISALGSIHDCFHDCFHFHT